MFLFFIWFCLLCCWDSLGVLRAGKIISKSQPAAGWFEIQSQLRRELEYKMLLTRWSQVGFVLLTLTNTCTIILFCTDTSPCQYYGLVSVQTSAHQAEEQHDLASCLKVCKGVMLVTVARVTTRAACIQVKWHSGSSFWFRRRAVPSLATCCQCSVLQHCNAYWSQNTFNQ